MPRSAKIVKLKVFIKPFLVQFSSICIYNCIYIYTHDVSIKHMVKLSTQGKIYRKGSNMLLGIPMSAVANLFPPMTLQHRLRFGTQILPELFLTSCYEAGHQKASAADLHIIWLQEYSSGNISITCLCFSCMFLEQSHGGHSLEGQRCCVAKETPHYAPGRVERYPWVHHVIVRLYHLAIR